MQTRGRRSRRGNRLIVRNVDEPDDDADADAGRHRRPESNGCRVFGTEDRVEKDTAQPKNIDRAVSWKSNSSRLV